MSLIGRMNTIMKDDLQEITCNEAHKLIPVFYFNILSCCKISANLEIYIVLTYIVYWL